MFESAPSTRGTLESKYCETGKNRRKGKEVGGISTGHGQLFGLLVGLHGRQLASQSPACAVEQGHEDTIHSSEGGVRLARAVRTPPPHIRGM